MKDIQRQISVRAGYQLFRGAVKSESGLATKYVARAIFDTAGNDSAGVSNKTIAAHGTGVFLPAKAIITRSYLQTVTGFTSAGNTATIALSAEAANDVLSALIVSNSVLVGAGFGTGVSDGTAANFKQVTVERELVATVAVQALTAGKLVLHVEYEIGD